MYLRHASASQTSNAATRASRPYEKYKCTACSGSFWVLCLRLVLATYMSKFNAGANTLTGAKVLLVIYSNTNVKKSVGCKRPEFCRTAPRKERSLVPRASTIAGMPAAGRMHASQHADQLCPDYNYSPQRRPSGTQTCAGKWDDENLVSLMKGWCVKGECRSTADNRFKSLLHSMVLQDVT